jgi:transposase
VYICPMEKEDFRTVDDAIRSSYRKKAITLIKKGTKKGVVAQMFGVDKNTVTNWWKNYQNFGVSSFQSKKKGVKSEDKKLLSAAQEKSVQMMIIDKMPDQLKLDYGLWTRKAVKELVFREFEVDLAINTMGDYLRRWGFTPQKPKKKAYEQCSKKVEKWLKDDYPAIVERAKKEHAEIQWGDETGVRNSCQHGRSYAPKGKTPTKQSMSKRFSLNMISTVNNQGKVQFMIYSENMNSDRLIQFMGQLIENSSKKVFLILDNLRVHHSNLVKEWIEENKEKIELFFLPAYSPEKNPDEYLNCDLKQGLSDKPAPKNQEKLKENLENHMNMLVENPNRVKKYFNHKDIQYAA